jgi:hypothetical protein
MARDLKVTPWSRSAFSFTHVILYVKHCVTEITRLNQDFVSNSMHKTHNIILFFEADLIVHRKTKRESGRDQDKNLQIPNHQSIPKRE